MAHFTLYQPTISFYIPKDTYTDAKLEEMADFLDAQMNRAVSAMQFSFAEKFGNIALHSTVDE